MTRSRKKTPIYRDGSTRPEDRRLIRRRLKNGNFDYYEKNLVNKYSFNDLTWHQSSILFQPYIDEIQKAYEAKVKLVQANRHPYCNRFGKQEALKKIAKELRRALFHNMWMTTNK